MTICLRKCGLLSKSVDTRFLHTVQRFGLISKVSGLPKSRKNVKKGLLEIMVFEGIKKVAQNQFLLISESFLASILELRSGQKSKNSGSVCASLSGRPSGSFWDHFGLHFGAILGSFGGHFWCFF